jgi:uncharacterized protein (DUF1684 family)
MRLFLVLVLLCSISCIAAQTQAKEEFNRSSYINTIKKDRKLKDIEMLKGDHSPIPEDEKTTFRNLNYFKPKVKFRKEAAFVRYDDAKRFLMKTTTDRLPEYSLYGAISFRHRGKEYKLNVYQNIELVKKPGFEKHLFIPFNDKTNGMDTYGGGRFLDITETGEDMLVIDFNLAYNPYCEYNHKYSCPIPPEANNLNIKIKAGEKKWHEK